MIGFATALTQYAQCVCCAHSYWARSHAVTPVVSLDQAEPTESSECHLAVLIGYTCGRPRLVDFDTEMTTGLPNFRREPNAPTITVWMMSSIGPPFPVLRLEYPR